MICSGKQSIEQNTNHGESGSSNKDFFSDFPGCSDGASFTIVVRELGNIQKQNNTILSKTNGEGLGDRCCWHDSGKDIHSNDTSIHVLRRSKSSRIQ